MTTGGAIDPAGIPHFTGNLDEVEKSATGVHKAAKNLAEHGHGVHSTFQGLSAFYQAPEAEKLFASTHTIPEKADSLKDELFTVASALEDYATAVRPIIVRIEHIRAQAATFAASVEGDDDWHKDADKVSTNSGLRHDLAVAMEDFATAQNDCATKISSLVGGHEYMLTPTGDKALIPKNAQFNGYDAEAWEHAEKTPWGSPVEREYEGVEWLWHQTKSLVWDGFIINGLGGTVDGLATLTGFHGWDQAGTAWKGLGDVVGGIGQYTMTPYDWVMDHTIGPDEESAGEKRQKEAAKNFFKGFVAYDDWKENPARAAGTLGFNALTLAAGAGTGAAAKGGAGARALSALGKAGRLADPITYIGKAGSFAVVKVGDAFTALKNLSGSSTTLHLTDGGSFTPHEATAGLPERPAAIPEDAIPGTDELGRTVYLDTETGHLLNADGSIHQYVDDAVKERPPVHADTTAPGQTVRQPEAVGAHAGTNAVGGTGRAGTHATGGGARGLGPTGPETARTGATAHAGSGAGHTAGATSLDEITRAREAAADSGHHGTGSHGDDLSNPCEERPDGDSGPDQDSAPTDAARHHTQAELQEIARRQVERANSDKQYFKDFYKKNGNRKLLVPDETGLIPPQLVKPEPNGPWISVADAPDPIPPDYLTRGIEGTRGTAGAHAIDTLDDSAHTRHEAITADKAAENRLTAAKKALAQHHSQANVDAVAAADKAHKPLHRHMGESAEAYGEAIAEHHVVPEHYPGYERMELDGPKNGNDQFDQVWRHPDGRMVVIEAKSSTRTTLGARNLPSGIRVSQGTREYFNDILREMRKRGKRNPREQELAEQLEEALADGKLDYIAVKGNVNTGHYTGFTMDKFDIG
ncbi:hypothetical protein ACGFS9_00530 [Streptomyces sp. NPDC048566]|uniref:hypothetical protein n=1 Tax=Streptomyces sp. NPDC048566 TaxID=3365569 RepID=UPI003716CE0F